MATLAIAIAPLAWAQEANPEPAYCAQYYPNADCNSIGPKTPDTPKALKRGPREVTPGPPPMLAQAARKPRQASRRRSR